MTEHADFIVIGAGIAGASIASLLAELGDVVLLEAETAPGYHATGRSAAYFAPAYGNEVVRNVTRAGQGFYLQPPDGFSEAPLFRPRPSVFVGREDQHGSLDRMREDNPALVPMDRDGLLAEIPILDGGTIVAGLKDDTGGDLDVDAILQGYLRAFRTRGGRLQTGARIRNIARQGNHWLVETAQERWLGAVVINAAGAWADNVATMAGVGELGLQPKRRTAVLIDPPRDIDIDDFPLVIGVDEDFYFKPEAGLLLVSPADETPSPPTDAQPEEIDVAIAVDRFTSVTTVRVERVRHRWAGLRTFAPDKTFVVGFDPRASGFFWLAGQGGYGVQSAPGLSRLAHHLITGTSLPAEYETLAASMVAVDPARLLQP